MLLQLSTTGKDESPYKGELPLLAMDNVVNTNTSDTTENSIEHRVPSINIIEATTNKAKYDPLTLFKLICAQKHDVFIRTAIAQVDHVKSIFRIYFSVLLQQISAVDSTI